MNFWGFENIFFPVCSVMMLQKQAQNKGKDKDGIKQVVYCTMNEKANGYGIIDLHIWVLKTALLYLYFHLHKGLCDCVLSSSELPPF